MNESRQELKAIQDYLKREAPRKYDERRIYYVYQHYNNNPERGEVGCRYIGKGKERRAWDVKRNIYWGRIFSKEFPPEVLFVAENLTEEEAFEIEKWMIADARAAGVKLCNITDGGEGASGLRLSDISRNKISRANLGKILSEETKKKMSAAQTGHGCSAETKDKIRLSAAGKKRGPFTEEHKHKIAESNRGKRHTEEAREKIAAALRGKKRPAFSEETRRKISLAQRGRHVSDEARRNMSRAWENRRKTPCSEETRRKISEASSKRVTSEETKRKQSISIKAAKSSPEARKRQSDATKLWWKMRREEKEKNL